MTILDTNIIIGRLKNDTPVVRALDTLRRRNENFALSVITELELFAHPALHNDDIIIIERFLRTVRIVPLDSTIARHAATLRRSKLLQLGDSIIAATAFLLNAPLMTYDQGFKKVKNIHIIIP